MLEIRLCTKANFDQIITNIVDFWGSDRTLALHHPMFIHEFGSTAHVICDEQRVAAYLFGFFSQTEPTAYIHLVAARTEYRRQKLAHRLYDHFAAFAQQSGCTKLKAISTPTNVTPIAFHQGIGFTLLGESNANGIPVISDYSGPNQDRVVFIKPLG